MTHPLDIPEYLRIPQEERRAAWIGHTFTSPYVAPVRAAECRELERKLAERRRDKARARIATMKHRMAEKDAHDSIPTSRREWNPRLSRWQVATVRAAAKPVYIEPAAPGADKPAAPQARVQLDLFA